MALGPPLLSSIKRSLSARSRANGPSLTHSRSFLTTSPSQSSADMSQIARPAAMASDPDLSDPNAKSKTPSTASSSHQNNTISVAPRRGRYDASGRKRKKLRSQYPRGSTENHVEYILVASFDIDRGPVMEHQYPVAITGDEHMLAELMLPDQAHVRNQDWTIFFLHKDSSQEEEEAERRAREERRARRARRRDRAKGIIHESDDEADGTGLDDDGWDDDSTDSEPEINEGPPLIYVLNLVNTKQDKTVKRGAIVKAMAICTRHPFLHIYKVISNIDLPRACSG